MSWRIRKISLTMRKSNENGMAMFKSLYIIGNGFDLFHGIPSTYYDFKEYLEEQDAEVSGFVDDYLSNYDDNFWGSFESNLAELYIDAIIDVASNFLIGYGAEDWSDSYHHDYQYEIDRVVSGLSATLFSLFSDWVKTLSIPLQQKYKGKMLKIETDALFLNFNYTNTLIELYGVAKENIEFIHGCLDRKDIVLGHGWTRNTKADFDEDTDVRIIEGDKIIDHYFEKTFKDTEKVILDHDDFFNKLKEIENVYVIGHSLSDVDQPYFLKILECLNINSVRWKVSYFNNIEPVRERFRYLDSPDELVEYINIDNWS